MKLPLYSGHSANILYLANEVAPIFRTLILDSMVFQIYSILYLANEVAPIFRTLSQYTIPG